MIESDRNVLHQIPGPHVAWSRVNTAESIVGVQTPLSWSFWDQGGELGFRRRYPGHRSQQERRTATHR